MDVVFCSPIRVCAKATQLSLFLQTLCSVLKHRGTALSANKEAERLTLRPQPLSCTEALSLLLCWASLSRDTALLSQIHALSEKHKVKELIGECYRVCGCCFWPKKGALVLFHWCHTWNLECSIWHFQSCIYTCIAALIVHKHDQHMP